MSHRTLGAALLAAASLLTFAPAAAPAAAKPDDVTVMTRNVYVGADLIKLATAPDKTAFEQGASELYQTVLRNDFRTRAKGLAAEIKKAKPDLVGVQEAARWLRGPDGIKDGPTTPANQVIYDSATEIVNALSAVGQRYRVVSARDWFDFEAPTSMGFDGRIIQRDVILARVGSKVKVLKSFRGGFKDHFDAPTQYGIARQLRGWVGVDARIGKRSFRFASTHLEAYNPEIGDKQAAQLLKGPLASKKRQTILVGDLNSGDAKDHEPEQPGDQAIAAAGFKPRRSKVDSCCFNTLNGNTGWDHNVDWIMAKPKVKLVRSSLTGTETTKLPEGLLASDHGGVVSTLRLR